MNILSFWIIQLIFFYSITVSESEETDELLELHLELYRNHSGSVPSCDNVTSNLEPAELVFPVACCIPCSCLPTCKMKRNCCPELWSRTNPGSVLMDSPLRNQPKPVNVSDVINNKATDIPEFLPGSGSMTSPLNTTEKNGQVSFGKNTSDSILIIGDITNTETTNIERNDADAICIRPQVLYHPNYVLDSEAYKMIASCKDTFPDKITAEKCHVRMEGMDILEIIPVTSRLTGLSYINKYCLRCNEAEAFHSSFYDEWEAKYVRYSNSYTSWFLFSPNSLLEIIRISRIGFGNIHFVPNSWSHVQKCDTYDVTSCNKTGQWDAYDAMMENLCDNGHSLPILHFIGYNKILRFKNIACVHCNMGYELNDSALSCGYYDYPAGSLYSYSQTLNVRSTSVNSKPEWDKIHALYTDNAVIGLPKTKKCPPGYIALLGRCRRVICPRDYYIHDNKCEPLYRSLTGMDLNVKIKITPRRVISNALFSDLLEELGNIVNKSLSNCTTLQARDVGIWYGPKSSKPANKYYLFDIFLYNASGPIQYSDGVNEIRTFYDSLKAQDQLWLPNNVEVRLEINFIYSLIARFSKYFDTSISGDGSLKPVGDQGWGAFDRPHMVISNINWCYRAAFTEVAKSGGRETYYIRPAEINVYQYEYDATYVNFGNGSGMDILYLCLDMFKNFRYVANGQTNDENEQIYPKIFRGEIDEEDVTVNITTPVAVVIVSGLVLLLFAIGFCKMRFASRQRPLQLAAIHGDKVKLNEIVNDKRIVEVGQEIVMGESGQPDSDVQKNVNKVVTIE